MTRGYRFALASLFALGMATVATSASAQQWGPSAQSKVYHDPSNPPTYMAYNTSTTTVQPRPSANVQATGVQRTTGQAVTRRRTVAANHRPVVRQTTAQ